MLIIAKRKELIINELCSTWNIYAKKLHKYTMLKSVLKSVNRLVVSADLLYYNNIRRRENRASEAKFGKNRRLA